MTDPFTPQSLRLTPEPPIATATSEPTLAFLTGPALRMVIAERMEQIERHGYLPDDDLNYDGAELALAGKTYVDTYIDLALHPEDNSVQLRTDIPESWPFHHDFWKEPGPADQAKALTKAIALLLAELDRHLATLDLIQAARPLAQNDRRDSLVLRDQTAEVGCGSCGDTSIYSRREYEAARCIATCINCGRMIDGQAIIAGATGDPA